MLGHNGNPGTGFSFGINPAILFEAANYPNAPSLAAPVVAIVRQTRPWIYIYFLYLFLYY
jgi:hypothetical protein